MSMRRYLGLITVSLLFLAMAKPMWAAPAQKPMKRVPAQLKQAQAVYDKSAKHSGNVRRRLDRAIAKVDEAKKELREAESAYRRRAARMSLDARNGDPRQADPVENAWQDVLVARNHVVAQRNRARMQRQDFYKANAQTQAAKQRLAGLSAASLGRLQKSNPQRYQASRVKAAEIKVSRAAKGIGGATPRGVRVNLAANVVQRFDGAAPADRVRPANPNRPGGAPSGIRGSQN